MEHIIAMLENHLTFRDKETGKILAIEHQNGVLERYSCEPTTNARSLELFGADRAKLSNPITEQ
jgi:hypothetical protein